MQDCDGGEGQSRTGVRAGWDCLYPKRCKGAGGGCSFIFERRGNAGLDEGRVGVNLRLVAVEADGHGVEREGAKEVAAHALLDLNEGAGCRVDPVNGEG